MAADSGRGAWGSVFQKYAGAVARGYARPGDGGLHIETRLLLAAISRANNTGHAVFNPRELSNILGRFEPDGSLKPASRSTIYDYVRRLKAAGLLVEGNERCLWLAREFWSRKRYGTAYCPVHQSRASASACSPWWRPDESDEDEPAEDWATDVHTDAVLETWTLGPGLLDDPAF